ncbi:MAG: hypothetical protein WBV28_05680 [Terracidiphilus sp.]
MDPQRSRLFLCFGLSQPHVFADLGRCPAALRKEITEETVGDLAGIDLVVLPLRGGNGPQHQGVEIHKDFIRIWDEAHNCASAAEVFG